MSKKSYSYGNIEVVKEIILEQFEITKDENDSQLASTLKIIINENSKTYVNQFKVSRALLSIDGVAKITMKGSTYYSGLKSKPQNP